MKRRILFLVGDTVRAHNDNHERLPAAFREIGWNAQLAPHETLAYDCGRVTCSAGDLTHFDLIWLVGFGNHTSFADRSQLLARIPSERLVNPIDALVYRHGKLYLAEFMPQMHVSSDAGHLVSQLDGGEWIAKPLAGSYGRAVVRVRDDPEGHDAIKRLTHDDHYVVLQRYAPEMASGEVRVLVAAGQIIASYRRLPDENFTANLATGGRAIAHTLNSAERELVEKLAQHLVGDGIRFAAVDIALPWLVEVNIANPGGLSTLQTLGKPQAARGVAEAIAATVTDPVQPGSTPG